MQILIVVVVAFHVLAGVFWAGSTFVLARAGGVGAEQLARPQLGAAGVAVIAGVVLWILMHAHGFHRAEAVLVLGACCAIAAGVVQALFAFVGTLRPRVGVGQRVAAGLLMVTVVCMAVARYV
ncbi:MAG TPA: hypothetical protein VNW46_06470 [Gemmatimonadaceae bacterium]|nr:hypothetical protein [Gemmatimonadaceae bacterium]